MTERRRTPADDRAWYLKTGHCGACGEPGGYCQCHPARPCACADLHTVGSGRAPDAIDAFADPVPTQEEALW